MTNETEHAELREDFRRRALAAGFAVALLALVSFILAETGAPLVRHGLSKEWWSIPFQIATGLISVSALAAVWVRRYRLARLLAMAQIELYTDDAEVAWKHVKGQYKELRSSLLLRTQVLRVDSFYLQARTALAAAIHAREASSRESFFGSAERMARRISNEEIRWADPLVPLILAPIAADGGEDERAAKLLLQAVEGFEKVDMHLRARAAQRRLGQALGGDRGHQLMATADEWMRDQEIKKPELMTRMLAPGWRD